MANILRIETAVTGWPGAPGSLTVYADSQDNVASVCSALRTFLDAVKSLIPSGVVFTIPNSGPIISDTTGDLVGTWAAGDVLIVTCTGSGGYAAAAGAVVHLKTAAVMDGRLLRGRIFLVPLVQSMYDTAGNLADTQLGSIRTAAASFVTACAGHLVIWHRPNTAHAGGSSPVVSSQVPDLAAVLRSRR